MMGTKIRRFAPVEQLTLDALVPTDHFYRPLDQILDLSFVRDLFDQLCAIHGLHLPSNGHILLS